MRLIFACTVTSSKTLVAARAKIRAAGRDASAPQHPKIGRPAYLMSDTASLRLLPKSPISQARFTTFDQAKVRKQLCDLCGLCEAAVWENRGGQGGARAQRGAGGWICQN